jgi:hypothetical protein
MSLFLFSLAFAGAALAVLVLGAVVAGLLIEFRDRRAALRNAARDARIAEGARRLVPTFAGLDGRTVALAVLEARP